MSERVRDWVTDHVRLPLADVLERYAYNARLRRERRQDRLDARIGHIVDRLTVVRRRK